MERTASQTPFTRHLRGWEYKELEHAAAALRELVDRPGWSVLMALLDDEARAINERLSSTDKALEQADYALAHGRLGGLGAAKAAIGAVLAKEEQARNALEASVGADAGGSNV